MTLYLVGGNVLENFLFSVGYTTNMRFNPNYDKNNHG